MFKRLAFLILACGQCEAFAATVQPTYSNMSGSWVATCPADGAGTAADCAIDCGYAQNAPLQVVCADTATCTMTLRETSRVDNDVCVLVNRGTYSMTFATVSNQQNLTASATVATKDVIAFVYSNSAWTDAYRRTINAITGNTTITGDITVTGGTVTGDNGESIDIGSATDNAFTFVRDSAGTVTLTAADDNATAALTILPGGAAPMALGGASTTTLTVTTDGTGTGEVVLPAASIGTPELAAPGRGHFTICGDGTTINNNTIYYGPSQVPVAGAGRVCDITQAGNATEATADAPVYEAFAFDVVGMDCVTANPGASGVSFTLRNNAAATVPSVTCSVANTKTNCFANIQTTTTIASGNPVSIAAASAGDQAATPFACTVFTSW